MIVKNRKELLAVNPAEPTSIALDLMEEGVSSVLPDRIIENHLKLEERNLVSGDEEYRLEGIDRVFVIGGGKASYGMARAVERSIGSLVTDGLIVTKRGEGSGDLDHVKIREASHPVPDVAGVEATEELINLAGTAGDRDLVVVLISGGGSALLTLPLEDIELGDLKGLTEDLLASGASIGEINTIRKRLSRIKGGRLARAIHPAKCLSLMISDVVGDDLRYIASGPTVPETASPEVALGVLEKYGLKDKHEKVAAVLKGRDPSTIPVTEGEFSRFQVTNQIVASNETALTAMAKKADEMGITPMILSSRLEGDSRVVGKTCGQLTRSIYEEDHPLPRPGLLLSGGETTVTLSGSPGIGGPNQEFVLGGGTEIIDLPNSVFGAIDSDGEDGSTGIAGGIVTGGSEVDEEESNAYLENHDASSVLKKIGGAIITGQTGTNVNDIRLSLVL